MHNTPFTPPGPGAWYLDAAHFPKPMSRLVGGLVDAAMRDGFSLGTARYGVALSHFEIAQVNGFLYQKAVVFGAPPGATATPPKLVFQALTRLHPALRARWRTAEAALEKKLWREDLRRWDEEVKPASLRRNRALAAVDPAALDDAALLAHLEDCHRHLGAMLRQHHEFTVTCIVPVGDLLAHVHAWTGASPTETLAALRGSSPVSLGAHEERSALGRALRDDPAALAALDTQRPADALATLRAHPGPAGDAARRYLDEVGYQTLGYDVAEPYAYEMPELLVRTLRAALDPTPPRDAGNVDALRARVPAEHRARFDELLAEARLVNRLRDERGMYSEGRAIGTTRRGLLELARRIAARGTVAAPELVLEGSWEEVMAMARGERPVADDELRARASWRATASAADAPPWLGAEPAKPPPAEWLPPAARRTQRAMAAFLECLFGEAPAAQRAPASASAPAHTLEGLPVHTGSYEGTARLVLTDRDFARVRQGDVLVARNTGPAYNVVVPLLGAIVTDRGGQLSHAAIVAREFGIPGVVGTRDATARIRDGARVRVDGTTGRVDVLS